MAPIPLIVSSQVMPDRVRIGTGHSLFYFHLQNISSQIPPSPNYVQSEAWALHLAPPAVASSLIHAMSVEKSSERPTSRR